MKVKIFLETAGNFEERELLFKFYDGAKLAGSRFDVKLDIGSTYSPCDVAVIMGSWKPRDKAHHVVRNSVVAAASCFVAIETALLGRKVLEPNTHYRIGVNGFLNNAGKFFVNNCPADRLHNLDIAWPDWQNFGRNNILLLLQLPGDASLRGTNVYEWAQWAVREIRKHSDKPIRVRTHPAHNPKAGDEFHDFVFDLAMNGDSGVSFSCGKTISLKQELEAAYCTVAFSSGSSIDSVLAGVPAITCDPGNFAFDISSHYIEDVKHPMQVDVATVQQWLANLAYSQWTAEEMKNSAAWRHLVPVIESIPQMPKGKR